MIFSNLILQIRGFTKSRVSTIRISQSKFVKSGFHQIGGLPNPDSGFAGFLHHLAMRRIMIWKN
jgi:hypothetical protein